MPTAFLRMKIFNVAAQLILSVDAGGTSEADNAKNSTDFLSAIFVTLRKILNETEAGIKNLEESLNP